MGRIETFQEEAPCGHANAWIKILKVTLLCCLKSISMQAWTEVYYWFNSNVRHSEGMKAKVKQFWQISCEAPEPGHSLCGAWCYRHGNQLTQCQSNNFVLRWINGRGKRGRESFRLNHRQAFTTAEIQQYAKVSKQVTADLSKEKLKRNLLNFCKISFIFDWGCKKQSYNCCGVSVGAVWTAVWTVGSIFYLKNWT